MSGFENNVISNYMYVYQVHCSFTVYRGIRGWCISVMYMAFLTSSLQFHSQSLHIYSSKNWILQDIVQCT